MTDHLVERADVGSTILSETDKRIGLARLAEQPASCRCYSKWRISMGKITVFENVTLDGVMQAPARPDEDTRGGFKHGGWAVRYNDEVMGRFAAKGMTAEGSLLLGRRTYEDFYAVWPKRTDGNPFTEVLNRRQKYVVSRTLHEPLRWMNSTLLKGDLAEAVAQLKQPDVGDLMILGSGDLVASLTRLHLVDQYILLIHPLVLGTGRRLFGDGIVPTDLALIDTQPTTTGVIIATYQLASG